MDSNALSVWKRAVLFAFLVLVLLLPPSCRHHRPPARCTFNLRTLSNQPSPKLYAHSIIRVDIYIGQLKCDMMWYASNNEMLHCQTPPLHWWGSGTPGYKLMYSNYITATLTSCPTCNFEYGADWTPSVRRSSAVMASRGTCRHTAL